MVASTVPLSAVPQSAGAEPVLILRIGEVLIVVSIWSRRALRTVVDSCNAIAYLRNKNGTGMAADAVLNKCGRASRDYVTGSCKSQPLSQASQHCWRCCYAQSSDTRMR
jgi:hypothetical protein